MIAFDLVHAGLIMLISIAVLALFYMLFEMAKEIDDIFAKSEARKKPQYESNKGAVMKDDKDDHIIPPLLDGYSWTQPWRHEIMVNDDTAVMSNEAASFLHRYDRSNPSGVYVGKMWIRGSHGVDFLLWYAVSDENPNMCKVEHRRLLIQDWKVLYGIEEPDATKPINISIAKGRTQPMTQILHGAKHVSPDT